MATQELTSKDTNQQMGITTDGSQFLTFQLGEELYGVDILRVQEIKGYTAVTRIPNTPSRGLPSASATSTGMSPTIVDNVMSAVLMVSYATVTLTVVSPQPSAVAVTSHVPLGIAGKRYCPFWSV